MTTKLCPKSLHNLNKQNKKDLHLRNRQKPRKCCQEFFDYSMFLLLNAEPFNVLKWKIIYYRNKPSYSFILGLNQKNQISLITLLLKLRWLDMHCFAIYALQLSYKASIVFTCQLCQHIVITSCSVIDCKVQCYQWHLYFMNYEA